MDNLVGLDFGKYIVIKVQDLDYLNKRELGELNHILSVVSVCRSFGGKNDNNYMVINTDEPYADEVIEVMKRYGHWGESTNKRLAVNKGICPFPNDCNERFECAKDSCYYDTCSNGYCYKLS